jgi:LPS O-antigen subunit length determinant protein (WzzB/FepE family)
MAVVAAGTAAYQANQNKHAVEAQLKEQQKQTDQAASAQMDDRIKQAREARAAARAAAAESGAMGNSVDAQLNDITFQASRDVSRIEKNRENGFNEAGVEANARYGEINGQLASAVAQSASSAGSAYTSYNATKK